MAKYLLIQKYEGGICEVPMGEWDPADIRAHIDFQIELNATLEKAGELVDAQGVSGPEQARRVTSDGTTPVITTGPFEGALLAGYRVVDVEDEQRALAIAAQASAAPGPARIPMQVPIEVRQLMTAP